MSWSRQCGVPRALPWTPRSMPDGQGLRSCRAAFPQRTRGGRRTERGQRRISEAQRVRRRLRRSVTRATRARLFFRSEVLHAIPHTPQAPSCMHFSVALLIREATSRSVSSLGVGPQAFTPQAFTTSHERRGRSWPLRVSNAHAATNRGTTDHNKSYRNTEPVGLTQRPAATLLPPPRRAERSLDAALHA